MLARTEPVRAAAVRLRPVSGAFPARFFAAFFRGFAGAFDGFPAFFAAARAVLSAIATDCFADVPPRRSVAMFFEIAFFE